MCTQLRSTGCSPANERRSCQGAQVLVAPSPRSASLQLGRWTSKVPTTRTGPDHAASLETPGRPLHMEPAASTRWQLFGVSARRCRIDSSDSIEGSCPMQLQLHHQTKMLLTHCDLKAAFRDPQRPHEGCMRVQRRRHRGRIFILGFANLLGVELLHLSYLT